MYIMLDLMKRRRRHVKRGFIHLPHKYDPKKATRVLAKALRRSVAEQENSFPPGKAYGKSLSRL